MAANNFQSGGVDNNWGTTGNWSLGSVPTSNDGNIATFNASSPNCTVNTSARVCNHIDFSAYTNTITMTNNISVSGNVTLGASMGVSGTGTLLVKTTSNMTSNGKTWPNNLTLNGSTFTATLIDNWAVTGAYTQGDSSSTVTLNGAFTMTVSGNLNLGAAAGGIAAGSATVIAGTSGTQSLTNGGGTCRVNLTFNAAGTVTMPATFSFNTGTLTYTAGTVDASGTTLTCNGANTTLAVNGLTWGAVTLSGVATITLSENVNCAGLLTLGSTTNALAVNGNAINCSGGVRLGGSSALVTGTTVIQVIATQTLDAPSLTSGSIANPIVINAPGGTVTIATAGDTPFRCLLNQVDAQAGTIVTDKGTWKTLGGKATYQLGI